MSAPDLIGPFPTEPRFESPEAVAEAARAIEKLAAPRVPKLRGFRQRAGYISLHRAARLAGRSDQLHGKPHRNLPAEYHAPYMEGRLGVARERAERTRKAWEAGIERGRIAYAATAGGEA